MTIDLEIKCTCGAKLEASIDYNYNDVTILVEPCSDCLAEARQDGYDEGHTDGFDEGHEDS